MRVIEDVNGKYSAPRRAFGKRPAHDRTLESTRPMPPLPTPDEVLGPLLRTLAETLDVREVFARISEQARRAVPHDHLLLGLLSEDRKNVTLIALSEDVPAQTAGAMFPEVLRPYLDSDGFVLNDMQPLPGNEMARGWVRPEGRSERLPVELPIQVIFRRMMLEQGIRSFLRVTVRLRKERLGGLLFCSRDSDAFPEDVMVPASQVAACVALAVEHDRLWRAEQE